MDYDSYSVLISYFYHIPATTTVKTKNLPISHGIDVFYVLIQNVDTIQIRSKKKKNKSFAASLYNQTLKNVDKQME